MTTQIIVNSNSIANDTPPQVENNSNQTASFSQPGAINPSRNITKDDEVYLRDYTLAAQVISWDECTFGTTLELSPQDITNIAFVNDIVWYQINYRQAIPIDIETFHAHRLRIEAHQASRAMAPECQPSDEVAADLARVGLQPTLAAQTEFATGRYHGQQDALSRLYPLYQRPCEAYAAGYVQGYERTMNPATSQPPHTQPTEWAVTYEPKWNWYQAWVGDRCIGQSSFHEEAQRLAQQYIATSEMILRQNAAVLKAYAG